MAISNALLAAAAAYAAGQPFTLPEGAVMIDHDVWARQVFTGASTTSIDFFTKPAANTGSNHRFFTNLNANYQLDNAVFVAEALGFSHEEGQLFADGTAVAAGSDAVATAAGANSTLAVDQANWIGRIFQSGLVNLTVAEKKLIRNQWGLNRWPAGFGLETAAALAAVGTSAGIDRAVISQNNGSPHVSNMRALRRKFILGENTGMSLTAEWQATLAAATPITLVASFRGMLFAAN